MLRQKIEDFNLPGTETIQIIIRRGHVDEDTESYFQLTLPVQEEELLDTEEIILFFGP